jgi:uncharacterized membrane protein YfcA
MSPNLLLAGVGFIAGVMNAVAGGGTFVTFPALVFAGVPSVAANATSTVALFPGSFASAWAYREDFRPMEGISPGKLLPLSIVGGVAGAVLLLLTPSSTFDFIIPWLLLLGTLAFAFGKQAGAALRSKVRLGPGVLICCQLFLAVYGGYFGGAVGIMMMAVWGLLSDRDFKDMHAPRTLLVGTANAVAVVIFIAAHAVYWREAAALMVGAVAGGLFGAWIGRRAPARVVRVITLTVACLITVAFFVKTLGR